MQTKILYFIFCDISTHVRAYARVASTKVARCGVTVNTKQTLCTLYCVLFDILHIMDTLHGENK